MRRVSRAPRVYQVSGVPPWRSMRHVCDNLEVCPRCGKTLSRERSRDHMRMTVDEARLRNGMMPIWRREDFLSFQFGQTQARSSIRASAMPLCAARGKICGCDTALFFMDANFMMGSMGSVVGEKICRAFEHATELGLPVVGFTVSGGARMQEGVTSLMQMAKISAAVRKHSEAGGLYITVLTDPDWRRNRELCHGGGDIILAEPDVLTAFAGPRVIEQNMHKRLPKGFQRSEFLLEHGFCDAVVPRGEIALTVGELLALHEGHAPGLGAPHEIVHTGRRGKKLGHLFKRSTAPKTALEIVKQTRSADRATAGEMISLGLDGCGAARRPLLWRRRRCGGRYWLEKRTPRNGHRHRARHHDQRAPQLWHGASRRAIAKRVA